MASRLGTLVLTLIILTVVACGEPAATPTATEVPSATEPAPQPTMPPEPADGTEPPPTAEPSDRAVAKVTGTLRYRERIALTPDAVVEVKLIDVSRADAPAITVEEHIIENPGQVPIAFEIEYDPAEIDTRFTYAIQVRIMEGDDLAFINDTTYQVITRDNPTHVDMVLVKVGAPSAPSEPVEPTVFEVGPCAMTLAAQLPIEFEYKGTIPTGFDGINTANCTFNKIVKTVTVTLTGPATHTEIFTLAEPSAEVSFPLPEGTLSISTLEIVPPGEYQRVMTVTSVDGETLVISDQPGDLKTVTILEPVVFVVGPCAVTLAVQLPIEFEYKGTVPTGFDGINRANCTFTKAVEKVTVVLTGPATHTEIFTLVEPSAEVSFPLPEGTLSISTLEIVPPGEYQREMTVTSVDGDTLVISNQPGVLKTVTILEPVVFEVGPCAMTMAAQLPIEFEYKGTIPTGFDGINQANCTFTRAVKTVTVTVTGPATHTEIFTLVEPSTEVSFPLPEDTLSISTLEIVPPGEYQREMTVTSVDGDTLVISDQPGVLNTVKILEATEFTYSFENGEQGWLTGFADLPANFELSAFELDSGHRPLPAGLDGSGMYLQGHNRSDDLFMFLKRQVEGLRPGTVYTTTVSLDLATNVPAGLVGIGGSPGESVYVKAGASAVEPVVEEDVAGHLRMNIDKGNQASEGEAMINLGNVAHPEVTGDEYKIKTLNNQERQFEVVSDDEGRIWLIVGTDSGFEGLSTVYYARITYIFTAT